MNINSTLSQFSGHYFNSSHLAIGSWPMSETMNRQRFPSMSEGWAVRWCEGKCCFMVFQGGYVTVCKLSLGEKWKMFCLILHIFWKWSRRSPYKTLPGPFACFIELTPNITPPPKKAYRYTKQKVHQHLGHQSTRGGASHCSGTTPAHYQPGAEYETRLSDIHNIFYSVQV